MADRDTSLSVAVWTTDISVGLPDATVAGSMTKTAASNSVWAMGRMVLTNWNVDALGLSAGLISVSPVWVSVQLKVPSTVSCPLKNWGTRICKASYAAATSAWLAPRTGVTE